MRLIALDIPDAASDLPGWLEGHLTGPELAALVAELQAVHGHAANTSPPLSLETILGSQRDAVLARGLESLPPDRLRQLLRHPRLLLDLQDLIVSAGGAYWQERARSSFDEPDASDERAVLDRGWEWLKANVIDASERGSADRTSLPFTAPRARRQPTRRRWGLLALSALATAAAAVALVVFLPLITDRGGPRPVGPGAVASGWGWNRPDALPQDLSAPAYLEHLADGAQEWYKKRPDDQLALANRLREFRQGCTVLIASPHRPLAAADRTWLIEKCRAWAAKLDTHLADLDSGQSVGKVRSDADDTINKLITALRERAKGLA
jgi:hypothetical protein